MYNLRVIFIDGSVTEDIEIESLACVNQYGDSIEIKTKRKVGFGEIQFLISFDNSKLNKIEIYRISEDNSND